MDEKRQLLKERRERLAALLASEREMFEVLRCVGGDDRKNCILQEELRDTGSSRLTHMKHRLVLHSGTSEYGTLRDQPFCLFISRAVAPLDFWCLESRFGVK